MSRKVEQGKETREKLIKIAQKRFAKHGFAGTRFDEIALSEGLTTGALYHHFRNKHDLFKAVFESCSREISTVVSLAADKSENIFTGILAGCEAYIRETISQKYKRIVLEDAISVLGWKEWKKIDDETSELSLLLAIQEAQSKKEISSIVNPKALARLISGATNELALWVSDSTDKESSLSEAIKALDLLVKNLKKEEV